MRGQPDFADAILALFSERGAEAVEIPVIQPADPFLDTAGEELRRRIFLTESETGQSLCLRPEFTIPVCVRHIDVHSGTPQRYAYLGQVFRQRRDGGNEFFQAGIEDHGNDDFAMADAQAVHDAADTLAMLLPDAPLQTTLGDQTLFEAVVEALGLPAGWQTRLIRTFGDHRHLDQMLNTLSKPVGENGGPKDALVILARAGDREGLVAKIDAQMRATGYLSNASRTPAEIADRMIAKTELANAHLDTGALGVLKDFLALETRLVDAPAALASFADVAGLDLGRALTVFEARVATLEKAGCVVKGLQYRAAFGRPLDYYTSLVFEMSSGGEVLAGGGRYDRLLTLLGAATPIPAVGFSLWLDRIEAARSGGSRGTAA